MHQDDVDWLLEEAAAAVLTTYRRDGSAATSPVWVGAHDGTLQVVIAEGDVKLRHLRHRPECMLVVFETAPPFRGVRWEGRPTLRETGVSESRLAIARRYLGSVDGARFTAERGAGVVVSMPLATARGWDLSGILPGPDPATPTG